MQVRKFFFYLWSIAFILPIFSLQAQVEKENEKGEKIIEYPNGATIPYKGNDSEIEMDMPMEDKIRTMSDDELKRLALRRLKEAQKEEKDQKHTTREFSIQKVKLEKQLKRLEASSKDNTTEIKKIKKELKRIQALEKDSRKKEKSSSKNINKIIKIVAAKENNRKKMLLKLYESEQQSTAGKSIDSVVLKKEQSTPSASSKKKNSTPTQEESTKRKTDEFVEEKAELPETTINADLPVPPKGKIKATSQKVFAEYKASEDVLLNPPTPECQLAFSGKDELTGQMRKDVAPQLLFAHTDEELRPYMKGKDYLTCQAYLTSVDGGYQFLTLEITIASKNAQMEYGLINKGSILTIKLINGNTVKLQATKSDLGIFDPYQESFVYKTSYRISGSGMKQLKNYEVDKIRVVWSSGYVDYEVYEVDFFIRQLACLNSSK